MRVHVQRTFDAEPKSVFDHFSDPDAFARAHSAHCNSIRYRLDGDRTAITEEEWAYAGRTYRISHRVHLEPPGAVWLETVDGVGRGARERVRLRPAGTGTEVHYDVVFSLPLGLRPLEPFIVARLREFVERLAEEDGRAIRRRVSRPGAPPARRPARSASAGR